MIFGVLSAIALGIGITATAQDLINEDATAQKDKPNSQIEEVLQHPQTDNGEWTR